MRIAAAQFDITDSVTSNATWIEKLARRAAEHKADVVVFPEGALSGYAPVHQPSPEDTDWAEIERQLPALRDLAAELDQWLIIGSIEQADPAPRLSALIIDDTGKQHGSYHKRHLAPSEVEAYSAGSDRMVLEIAGVKCGLMICHEQRFAQDYADYRADGVDVIFQPMFFANEPGPTPAGNMLEPRLRTRAEDNGLWIVAANSTGRHSPMPASVIRPDGSIKSAQRHRAGLIMDEQNPEST